MYKNLVPGTKMNHCLIDAFTCTFQAVYPETVICDMLHMNVDAWQHMDYGRHGYRQSYQFGAITLLYDGRMANMGVCLELTGQGCRELELLTHDSVFYDIMANKVASRTNLTRIDIAVDDFMGFLDMGAISKKVETGEIRTRLRAKTQYKGLADTDGHTIYIGSAGSNTHIRIYDKQAEQQTVYPWVRVEMVLRHEDARRFQKMVLDSVSVDTLCRNHEIALLGVGVLKDKLCFIEKTDANISRCEISPWWSEFLGTVEPLRLTGQAAEIPSLEKASKWLQKQVAPTLTLVLSLLGPAWLNSLLDYGYQRIDAARATTWLQEMAAFGISPALDPRSETLVKNIWMELMKYQSDR